MSSLRCIFVLMAVTFPLSLSAQWYEQGRPVKDREWRRSHKEFRAMLLLTSKPDEFLEAWDKPPAVDYAPEMTTTDEAVRGEAIVAFILFTGCQPDDEGFCDATTEFVILKPDGSEYAKLPSSELWQKKAPPPDQALQLGVAYIGVIIEPEDPLGEYMVKARVCDTVADRCLNLTRTFEAVEVE